MFGCEGGHLQRQSCSPNSARRGPLIGVPLECLGGVNSAVHSSIWAALRALKCLPRVHGLLTMNPNTCGASAELTGAINFNLGPKKGEIAQCGYVRELNTISRLDFEVLATSKRERTHPILG